MFYVLEWISDTEMYCRAVAGEPLAGCEPPLQGGVVTFDSPVYTDKQQPKVQAGAQAPVHTDGFGQILEGENGKIVFFI